MRELLLPASDGTLPVRVFEPESAPRGGVIFYMDAFGLRPELDAMCRRYAGMGYATFLPDLYYRLGKIRFPPPGSRDEPLDPNMHEANTATTVDMTIADTGAIVRHVAGSPGFGVHSFGAVGYCMGARHALAALAAYPSSIKAAACLHGGRMVCDGSNSPHRMIKKIRGRAYFAFAADDPTCPDAHKTMIEEAIAAAGVRAETEHFAAAHGWTFPQRWCYDHQAAEAVWDQVTTLFAEEVAKKAGPRG